MTACADLSHGVVQVGLRLSQPGLILHTELLVGPMENFSLDAELFRPHRCGVYWRLLAHLVAGCGGTQMEDFFLSLCIFFVL